MLLHLLQLSHHSEGCNQQHSKKKKKNSPCLNPVMKSGSTQTINDTLRHIRHAKEIIQPKKYLHFSTELYDKCWEEWCLYSSFIWVTQTWPWFLNHNGVVLHNTSNLVAQRRLYFSKHNCRFLFSVTSSLAHTPYCQTDTIRNFSEEKVITARRTTSAMYQS